MSIEQNKAVLLRYFEAVNSMDWKRVDQVIEADYSENYECISPSYQVEEPGLEGLKKWFHQGIGKMADVHITIEDLFGEGDKVATLYSVIFTDKTTRKKMSAWGIGISVFKDGKIVKEWMLDVPPEEVSSAGG